MPISTLAARAVISGALAEAGQFDRGFASLAGQARAGIDLEFMPKITGFARAVAEVAQGGAAFFYG